MTKRVFEAAREYGVQTKTVIQALAEHNIKASNFMGVDASMQAILDKKFKGAGSAEAAPSKPAEKRQPEKTRQRPVGRDGQNKGQADKKRPASARRPAANRTTTARSAEAKQTA